MKKIFLITAIIFTMNMAFSQTYLKITQGNGFTLSPSNSIDEISFTPTFTCGDVILYGGESYPTVQIGSQCWFAKNLNIGIMIQGTDQTNNNIIEKYCYNNSETNCITYGGYYQWDEAMQYVSTSGTQGICPPGWHLPSLPEFNVLSISALGSVNSVLILGEGNGSNTTGFSALLAGAISSSNFIWFDTYGAILSSVESSTNYYVYFLTPDSDLYATDYSKELGTTVRCLKN